LHTDLGKLASELWTYEPLYAGQVKILNDPKKMKIAQKYFHDARKLLNQHQYSEVVKSALKRYVRALDSRDLNGAYLKLWGVLEFLTNTQKDSYDETIKRATFDYFDRDMALQILYHLRDYRNEFVHEGYENQDVEQFLFQLKGFIENLFDFHIMNTNKFSNLKEAATFLGSSSVLKEIENELAKLEKDKSRLKKVRGHLLIEK
jgi:hypothetical protein